MKRPLFRLLSLAALAGSTLLLPACDKSDDPQQTPDVAVSAEDQALAEDESAALADLTDAAAPLDAATPNSPAAETDDLTRLAGRCFTRTYDALTRTLTIDFGSTNCVAPNGVARRGKIVTVFGGALREAGATKTITLVDYYRNDNQYTGTRIITRLGGGSWTLTERDASITTSGGTHSWTASRTYTHTAGQGTRTLADDEYSITGLTSGTNRKGLDYTAVIGQPLIKKFQPGCARTFVAGTVTIATEQHRDLLLNYDPTNTQTCDNIASITVNGKTRTIRVGGRL